MIKFLRVFGQGMRLGVRDFQMFFTWKSWLGAWMLRMITSATMWVMLGQLLGSPERLNYLLVGIAVTSGVGSIITAVTTWDRNNGVYPLLVASPLGPTPAILGRAAIWVFSWIPASLLTFAFLVVVFKFSVPPIAYLLLPPMVAVICFGAYGAPCFVGALVASAPQYANICGAIYLIIIMAFCGVSVPVAAWPEPVQAVAQVLPITHGLQAIRVMLAEGPADQVLRGIALEALVGAAWFALALATYRWMAERGRIDGSIDFEGAG